MSELNVLKSICSKYGIPVSNFIAYNVEHGETKKVEIKYDKNAKSRWNYDINWEIISIDVSSLLLDLQRSSDIDITLNEYKDFKRELWDFLYEKTSNKTNWSSVDPTLLSLYSLEYRKDLRQEQVSNLKELVLKNIESEGLNAQNLPFARFLIGISMDLLKEEDSFHQSEARDFIDKLIKGLLKDRNTKVIDTFYETFFNKRLSFINRNYMPLVYSLFEENNLPINKRLLDVKSINDELVINVNENNSLIFGFQYFKSKGFAKTMNDLLNVVNETKILNIESVKEEKVSKAQLYQFSLRINDDDALKKLQLLCDEFSNIICGETNINHTTFDFKDERNMIQEICTKCRTSILKESLDTSKEKKKLNKI